MTMSMKLHRVGRAAAALVLALVVAFTGMLANGAKAGADPRGALRADATGQCEWDGVGYWVQRCDVYSPSMGRNIPVLIKPAARGGNAGLYLLDGMRATDTTNAMANQTDAPKIYADRNITLVMPVGGAGSFYTDWYGNATFNIGETVVYKWETFLTSELPKYLSEQFGVARNNNSIAGISMGGTSAITLAAKHPEQFRQALSYSGYLAMTLPGTYALLSLAMIDVGNFNINQMYESLVSPKRFADDPLFNLDSLAAHNIPVWVSAASGFPDEDSANTPFGQIVAGTFLEAASRITTSLWEVRAAGAGVKVTTNYKDTGIHDWAQWNRQVHESAKFILDGMNAW